MKLALGTAQFGFDYGITNQRGKIPKEEVFEIIEFAINKGINTLDTAHTYGDSEKVIGEFIQKNKPNLKITSKLPAENDDVEEFFQISLKRLNSDKIYAYLIHDFKLFLEKPHILNQLQKFKENGKIEKIGFSLYHPKEVEYLLEKNISFDIVQIPFSIFDQRFSKILPLLKENNIEIHVRSVFLQGLVFKDPADLEGDFVKIKDKLSTLNSISKEINVPVSALCINFALLNENIDKVVIGVDSMENLQENIKSLEYQNDVENIYNRLSDLKEEDEKIILPTNWKINK